jgi:hypothetical protein
VPHALRHKQGNTLTDSKKFIHWFSEQEFLAEDDSLSDKHPMHYDLSAPRVRHKTIFNEPNE